jgi:16S rRNA (guanine966-N2)-methyltransferase
MGLRVTGGRLGGRRLLAPKTGVRPTADRVRESLFSHLGDLEGVAVLDLFAGTGALGIEALSRGAASLVAVELSRGVRQVLLGNLSSLSIRDEVRVEAASADAAVKKLGRAGARFDLIFLDPPYAAEAAAPVLGAIVAAGVLAEDGLVVFERGRSHPVPVIQGLQVVDERSYGDTVISELRHAASTDEPMDQDS